MVQRILPLGLMFVLLAWTDAPVAGQTSRLLVSQAEANRFGLERAWHTQIQFDRARGRIAHVRQHVSSKRSYTVYEIDSPQGRTVITDRDLDRFGQPLGKEEAEKQAQRVVQQLTRAGLTPQIQTRVVPEITLCVITDTGVVQSIDAETGRTRWVATIGKVGFVSEAPGMNDDYVAIVSGPNIFLLEEATGRILWKRRAMGAPGAGATLSDTYAFVPMVSGRLEAYRLDDPTEPPWIFQTHGRTMIQPTLIGNVVCWPTDKGHLNVAQAREPAIRYRLETDKSITAPATAMPPDRIVVVATDGYVYCINEANGSLVWSFSSGEPIINPAVVIDDSVFVVTQNNDLYCLAAANGIEKWPAPVPRVREVIGASRDRAYCLSDTGRLQIFDAQTGGSLGSLSTELLDLHLVNNQTDRLILGSRSGAIVCLREVRAPWPTIRAGVIREVEVQERPRPSRSTTEEPATEPGETTDPFSAPAGGADPFGAGGTDPFGGTRDAAPAAGSDPFADPFGGTP